MKKLILIIFALSILSFENPDVVREEAYGYLSGTATVEIDPTLADKINALIEKADTNFFLEGRSASDMENPDMVKTTIDKAIKSGGFCNGKTYFKDVIGDDMVHLSIETVYKKDSLKLVKKFKRKFKYTTGTPKHKTTIVQDQIVWLYEGTIKVEYALGVDGEVINGVHYQPSKIISPLRL